jgi:periplasmic protein TonB
MAYVDKQPLSQRLANLGTAGLIEAGIAVALIAGLSTTFVPRDDVPQIEATNYPSEPPPTPEAQPTEQMESTILVLEPPIKFPDPPIAVSTPVVDPPLTPTVPRGGDTPAREPSTPTYSSYKPVSAVPRNDPAAWVTPNDYPANDLRKGNQGTTRFRVIVGSNGRVQSCEITGTSGFASLDKVTCDRVTRRARFEAATDGTGTKVVGSYANAVVWRIPR